MVNFTILEPMSTGDIIDRAVRLYRRNFTALMGIVAVPSLIGYLASLMFWFGYSKLVLGITTGPPASAFLMLALGSLFYPLWFFSLLMAIAGLSRVVGDYVMLGEIITFRKCLSAVRRRLGDVVVMGLLSIAIAFGFYTVFSIVIFALMFVLVIVLAAAASMVPAGGMPQWVVGAVLGVVALAAVVGFAILMLVVLARVVFLPQVVMIEGQSAGNALGRAIKLGAGNWYRVGGIALFSYFVTWSLLAALTLPLLAVLYLTGALTPDFLAQPSWTVFYSAFSEISNLMVLPIWIVSFTLLYFDSRVRKEGYDVELLTRSLQPAAEPATLGRQPSYQPAFGFQSSSIQGGQSYGWASPGPAASREMCECGAVLEPAARFCHLCGARAASGQPDVSVLET